MNFLAHIYLSGNQEKILVGNFMGDYVKGRDYLKYPDEIKKGLLLHRKIDYFTDCHPVIRKSKEHVSDYYRKYSGIIIDIFYDYLLSTQWSRYSDTPLPVFAENVFELLKKYYEIFPQRMKSWFPNFIRNNWLMSYSTIEGIETVLHRMSSRTSLPDYTDDAIRILRRDLDEFKEEFNDFFPTIIDYVSEEEGIKTDHSIKAA